MLKNFHQKKIDGPESEREYRSQQTDSLIKEWYKNEDTNHSWQKKKAGSSKFFIIPLLLVIVIFTIILKPDKIDINTIKNRLNGIINNTGDNKNQEDILTLSIDGPNQATSGQEVSYIISWTNYNQASLQDLDLTIRYPSNFNFLNSDPTLPVNSGKNNWSLGSLEVKETQRLEIKGQILGSRGEEKLLSAVLMYKPINFHSKFKQEAEHKLIITDSSLDISLILPGNFLEHQPLVYEVNYQNTSLLDLNNVVLKIYEPDSFKGEIETLPKGASLENSTNATTEIKESRILVFSKLKSKEQDKIKIKGEFKNNAGFLAEFKAEIGLLNKEKIFNLQNQALKIAGVIKPEVKILFNYVNQEEKDTESSGNDKNFSFGDNITTEVKLQNLSSLNLKNGILSLSIEDGEGLIKNNKIDFLTSLADEGESEVDNQRVSQSESEIIKDSNDKSKIQAIWRIINDFKPADELVLKLNFNLIEVPLNIEADSQIKFSGKFSAVSEDVSVPLSWSSEIFSLHIAK